jgi:hypothetical protein
MRLSLSVPGLDCAASRLGTGVEGEAVVRLSFDTGGHSGLLVFKIGLDMSLLSIDGVREERDDGPRLPLRDSVSFDHEMERLDRVFACGVFFSGDRGGVTSPMGTRWSTSLRERFNLSSAASSTGIVAQVGDADAWLLRHCGVQNENDTHGIVLIFYVCCQR